MLARSLADARRAASSCCRRLDGEPGLDQPADEFRVGIGGTHPGQHVGVEPIPQAGVLDQRAGALARDHQPFGGQHLGRFAHGGAADTEFGAQLQLGRQR